MKTIPHPSAPTRRLAFNEYKRLQYLVTTLTYTGKFFGNQVMTKSLNFLTDSHKHRLAVKLLAKGRHDGIEIEYAQRQLRDASSTSSEILESLARNEHLKPHIFREVYTTLNSILTRRTPPVTSSGFGRKLEELGTLFGLQTAEKEVLTVTYLVTSDATIEALMDDLCEFFQLRNSYRNPTRSIKPIAVLTGLSQAEIGKALGNDSILMRTGLVDCEIGIPAEVSSFMEGHNSRPVAQQYFTRFTGQPLPLEAHIQTASHIPTLKTLVSNPNRSRSVNILLYGEPGTGKTECARSLAAHLGLCACEINAMPHSETKDNQADLFRIRALIACRRMTEADRTLVIVDEADAVLNGSTSFWGSQTPEHKGQLNNVLDTVGGTTVWISNRTDGIDRSTRRRFDYSIGFTRLSWLQRCQIWQTAVRKHRLCQCFSKSEIESFATEFEAGAGGIDVALRNAAPLWRSTRDRAQATQLVKSLLKAHLRIVDSKVSFKDTRSAACADYGLDGLKVSVDLERLFTTLERFNSRWTPDSDAEIVTTMNLLLYGPPGTGKTEFAKYTARRLNRRLIVKRSSDLQNCYVGETEKRIRAAFEEAAADRAVLFVDEADSMLGTREGAQHNWEISFVNEFLTNMEHFRGILICATNFMKVLDTAANRRFNFKIGFDFLDPHGAEVFFARFFTPLKTGPLTPREQNRLRSLKGLTPGDFKVVYQQHALLDSGTITNEKLIDCLYGECNGRPGTKANGIGFTA